MLNLLRRLFDLGPLLFGLGFIAPLIAQSLDTLGMQAPLGLSNLAFGLVSGAVLGGMAIWRQRWLV